MNRCLIILSFLCITVQLAHAQSSRFRHLNVDDGLIQNSINAIAQDKTGFMWFGTSSGLNRYDGNEIKTFRHSSTDPNTLSSNNIVYLFADSQTDLWICTRGGGLNRMDLITHKIERFKVDAKGNGFLSDKNTLGVVQDKNGLLYIGTTQGGVNVYNKKTKKFTYILNDVNDSTSIASNYVRSLCIDKNGNLWLGHGKDGVSCYNLKTKKARRYSAAFTNPDFRLNTNNSFKSIFCDSRNRVWISTWSGGFNVYDHQLGKLFSNSASTSDPLANQFLTKSSLDSSFGKRTDDYKYTSLNFCRMIFGFTEDKQGNIWIATVEEGLVCFNPRNGHIRKFKSNPNDPSSICDNNLLSIYIDRSGLVWAGSLSAGLSVFNPYSDKFGHYKADVNTPFSMANNQVLGGLHVGKYTRNIYVPVLGYVYRFDGQTNRFFNYVVDKKGNPLLHNQAIIQSLLEDEKGNLWISVNGSGVYVYDTTQKTIVHNYNLGSDPSTLNSNTVNYLFQDKFKNIWMGLDYYGIDQFEPKTGTFRHNFYEEGKKDKLSAMIVRFITDDRDGNLWIVTDSGVNVMNPVTRAITVYRAKPNEPNSLPSNDVQTVYRDRRNKMWVGTTNGLCRFDPEKKQFIDLTKKYNVASSGVYGMTEDLDNNLWLTTVRGVIRFNTVTFAWKEFDVSDGLQSNEFPANTIVSLDDGHILMGGAKGLNYFLPAQLIENHVVPNISITNFLLRNQPLNTGNTISFVNEIELNYDHYFFTIEFAALDFTNVSKNKYRYKLEGFSNEWIELGNKRQVTFVNLDPGEYLFRIAGSNNDGTWNERGATLKIVITPPFWRTKWFYALCALTVLLGIYAFIKYRERKLNREKAVLEEKVNVRTIELREEKEKVEEANKEIRDSINYAQKIQHAIMPSVNDFKKTLPDSFILFSPKDIVSGDFYWISHLPEGTVLYATADCTGHGVPGGFMSMLGTSFLNEIVNEKNITDPGKVLTILRDKVINALKQTGAQGENKDGMDIVLVKLDLKNKIMSCAGANNPLWILKKGESTMTEIKPDKQPIGYYVNQTEFKTQSIQLSAGDCIFSFTDGFADQFGGPKGKKFKYSSLEKILMELDKTNFNEAGETLKNVIEQWKAWPNEKGEILAYEQTDDVCVIGVRV